MVIFKQFKRESDLLLHCLQTFCLLQHSALTAQSHNNVSVFFSACQLPCTVQIHKSPSSMFNSTTCSSASNPAHHLPHDYCPQSCPPQPHHHASTYMSKRKAYQLCQISLNNPK